jgi:hypothetical protein
VGTDFALEVVEDRLAERNVLVVAQAAVGLGVALGIGADVRRGVALGEGVGDGLELWRGQLELLCVQHGLKVT